MVAAAAKAEDRKAARSGRAVRRRLARGHRARARADRVVRRPPPPRRSRPPPDRPVKRMQLPMVVQSLLSTGHSPTRSPLAALLPPSAVCRLSPTPRRRLLGQDAAGGGAKLRFPNGADATQCLQPPVAGGLRQVRHAPYAQLFDQAG